MPSPPPPPPPHIYYIILLQFEQFYTKKHSGRALSWLHPLSLAELKLSYLKKPYTACVSAYQMAVLLAFNQSESITMAALSQWTHLPPDELAATVRSLTDTKLLQTEGERSEVDGESLIKLNMNYSNKRTKFKITAAFQKESTQVGVVCITSIVSCDLLGIMWQRYPYKVVSCDLLLL